MATAPVRHSSSFDQRRRPDTFFIAITNAKSTPNQKKRNRPQSWVLGGISAYEEGIVSPIYKCFRFQPSENPAFWEWYFESGSHDPALGGLVNEGARAGRFNISVTQFLSTNA